MYAAVGGTEVFYTVTGSGRPFLVPSMAGTPIYERTFTPALGDALQLIFAELRSNRTSASDAPRSPPRTFRPCVPPGSRWT